MLSPRRRWAAGALLVGLGWLAAPSAVPIYDGVGVPDEPYRYVSPPPGQAPTPDATEAVGTTPVLTGLGTNGMVVATAEQAPQFSLYLPPRALAATGGPIDVRSTPAAPTDHPLPKLIAGNVYLVTFTSPAGPVTTTDKINIASLFMRAVDASDGWQLFYRPSDGAPWEGVETSRGGTDSFVAGFRGAGHYALAKAPEGQSGQGGGRPALPLVLGGAVALLVILVVVIRSRAADE